MQPGEIEAIAREYLRFHRQQQPQARPIDIMRLPPADFHGYRIEIRNNETMVLTGANQETHELSLKKMIVQVDKELGIFGRSYPATPRELAKMLIRTGVERHESIQQLAESHQGMGWYGYSVSISGYIRQGKKLKYVDMWHILVSEFEGEECAYIFELQDIYQEIELEIKQGFTVTQPPLF